MSHPRLSCKLYVHKGQRGLLGYHASIHELKEGTLCSQAYLHPFYFQEKNVTVRMETIAWWKMYFLFYLVMSYRAC